MAQTMEQTKKILFRNNMLAEFVNLFHTTGLFLQPLKTTMKLLEMNIRRDSDQL